MAKQKLPLGIQDFEELRKGNIERLEKGLVLVYNELWFG